MTIKPHWTTNPLPTWAKRWAETFAGDRLMPGRGLVRVPEDPEDRLRSLFEHWVRMTQPADIFAAWRECPDGRLMLPLLQRCAQSTLVDPAIRVVNAFAETLFGPDGLGGGLIDLETARERFESHDLVFMLSQLGKRAGDHGWGHHLRMPRREMPAEWAKEGIEPTVARSLVEDITQACEAVTHQHLAFGTMAVLIRRAFPLPPPEVQILLSDPGTFPLEAGEIGPDEEG